MSTIGIFKNSPDTVSFAAGQTIFQEGQAGDVMYVVREGEVEIRHNDMVLDTLGPGQLFGEMALIENAPRSGSAVARTDCHVVPITEAAFFRIISYNPHFALQVMRVISARLRRRMA